LAIELEQPKKRAAAQVDGWELGMASTDEGILIVFMRRKGDNGEVELRTFENNQWYPDEPSVWVPVPNNITEENVTELLTQLADLAERAEWKIITFDSQHII
jgi:hypothetical protein